MPEDELVTQLKGWQKDGQAAKDPAKMIADRMGEAEKAVGDYTKNAVRGLIAPFTWKPPSPSQLDEPKSKKTGK